jgi:hypothetical protein
MGRTGASSGASAVHPRWVGGTFACVGRVSVPRRPGPPRGGVRPPGVRVTSGLRPLTS